MIILSLVILIFSIIAHEVAHGYAANSLGDPTARLAGRLTLNPVPHIDMIGSIVLPAILVLTHSPILFGWAKPVPYNPYNLRNQRWGEVGVAIAGIVTNLFLALIFASIIRFGIGVGLSEPVLQFAGEIAFINLFLGLFNLIPFPPLDGFTALRAALPWKLSSSLHRFEQSIHGGGATSLIVFLFLFSYVFATPFYALVHTVFGLLTGLGI
jgi:Zn-dependent protease